MEELLVEVSPMRPVTLALNGEQRLERFQRLDRALKADRSWLDAVFGRGLSNDRADEIVGQNVSPDLLPYATAAIPLFTPKKNFAKEWANLARQAGCRYLVFTTKHHDGFALHDSQVSEFDAGSVLQRDLVEEIVKACRAEGVKVGFYHSVIDWHHDQFDYAKSKSIPHPLRGQPYSNGERDEQRYIKYLHAQVDELVTATHSFQSFARSGLASTLAQLAMFGRL